jgi:hypothetical protein
MITKAGPAGTPRSSVVSRMAKLFSMPPYQRALAFPLKQSDRVLHPKIWLNVDAQVGMQIDFQRHEPSGYCEMPAR